ncbi:hypothetical protein ACFL6W_00425 [Thermodesulfobacteriota bacterium]
MEAGINIYNPEKDSPNLQINVMPNLCLFKEDKEKKRLIDTLLLNYQWMIDTIWNILNGSNKV